MTSATTTADDRQHGRQPARWLAAGLQADVHAVPASVAGTIAAPSSPPVMCRPIASTSDAPGCLERRGHPALVHDEDPVGQGEQLLELLGDQQDGRPAGTQVEQQLVDALDRADVETARGLDRDEEASAPRRSRGPG